MNFEWIFTEDGTFTKIKPEIKKQAPAGPKLSHVAIQKIAINKGYIFQYSTQSLRYIYSIKHKKKIDVETKADVPTPKPKQ